MDPHLADGAAASAMADPRPKRPRNGRPHADILVPIENDAVTRGPDRDARELLYDLAKSPSARREPLAETLRVQAGELDKLFLVARGTVVDSVMET
jgi:hypothetical protein